MRSFCFLFRRYLNDPEEGSLNINFEMKGITVKRLLKFTSICFVVVLVLASCATKQYAITYSSQFIEGDEYDSSFLPSTPDGLTQSYKSPSKDTELLQPLEAEEGYIFKGWIESGEDENSAEQTYSLRKKTKGDKSFVALWDLTQYSLKYEVRFVSGKDYPDSLLPSLPALPESYTVADVDTSIPALACSGFVFKGWIVKGEDESNAEQTYTLEGSLGDITLVALWDLEEYEVSYSSRFISGTDYPSSLLPGTWDELPSSYTIADAGVVTLGSLSRDGYIFKGWILDGMSESQAVMSYTLEEGILGDKNIVALWDLEKYSLEFTSSFTGSADYPESLVPDLPSLPTYYTLSDEGTVLPSLSKPGYVFKGWIEEGMDESEAVLTYTLGKGELGDRKVVALWDLDVYSLEYSARFISGDSYDEGLVPELPVLRDSYTINDVGAVLPELSKPGYVFKGWIEEGKDESEAVLTYTLEEGVLGDRKITALWDLEKYEVTYSARFISDAGYPSELIPVPGDDLPSFYTIADCGKLTLNPLSEDGYVFKGWILEGMDESQALLSYTVEEGLLGDRKVVALWDLDVYSLEYSARFISGDSYDESLVPELPVLLDSYTINDVGAVLPELSKPGYVFKGWIEDGSDESEAVLTYTLEEGVLGDRKITALWDLEKYSLEFTSSFISSADYPESLVPALPSLPTYYTLSDEGAVLPSLSCPGYIFKGWIEEGMDESKAVMTYTLEKGELGDRKIAALWDLEVYPLSYSSRFVSGTDYDKSLIPDLPSLLDSYTISDVGAVLPVLSKDGYIFRGWIEDGSDESTAVLTYTLEEGVLGERSIVALWDLDVYSLEYSARFINGDSYDEGLVPELPVLLDSYTINDRGAVLPVLSKPGYIFKGWIEEGNDESEAVLTYTLEEGVLGDRKITALWDLEKYALTFSSYVENGRNGEEAPELPVLLECYTIADKGAVLPLLSKPGYEFIGWVEEGKDESEAVQTYTLEEGVLGERSVVALWKTIAYSITYSARFIQGDDYSSYTVPLLPELLNVYTVEDVGIYLPELGQSGYVFKGWIEEGKDESEAVLTYTLEEGVLGDRSVVALWDVVKYPITYDEDGIIENDPLPPEPEKEPEPVPEPVIPENRKSYTVEDEVTFINPTREGFTFLGWIEKDESVENADEDYRIEIGTVGEKNLVAVWHRNAYSITYDLNDGVFTGESTVSYMYDEQNGVPLASPVRDSYIFTGWKEKTSGIVYTDDFSDTAAARDIELEALWKPVVYTIEYDLNGGEMEDAENPSSYTYETETFTLITPKRTGYRFTGWTTEETVDFDPELFSLTFTVENIDITVRMHTGKSEWVFPLFFSEADLDSVEAFLNANFPEAETRRNGNIITLDYQNSDSTMLENVVRRIASDAGFVFECEDRRTEEVGYSEVTICQGSSGDRKYRAEWELITYTLTYGSEEDYAVRFPAPEPEIPVNPTTFTVEDDTFTLINPEKLGYDFMGWVLEDEEYTDAKMTVTIEKGSTEDRVYIPLFRIHDYSITVDLDGGEGGYPETFTIDDSSFTLERPVREHYIFSGWIDASGSVSEDAVINTRGGKDCSFRALWTPVTYSLTYNLAGGEYLKGEGNSENYNVESEITLTSPVRHGYTFLGWKENDESKPVVGLVLDSENGLDRSFTAVWSADVHSITYDLGGGEFTCEAVTSYTIEDTVVLQTPQRHGYTFLGWVNADGEERSDVDTSLCTDQVFTALWETIEYKVKYDLREGVYERGTRENITSYTVETPDFLVTNPVRDMYEFAGWVLEEREDKDFAVVDYTIDTGKGGDLSLVATWKEAEYAITYDLDGGEFEYSDSNRSSFTNFDEEFSLISPSRDGYTFLGWIEEGKEGSRPVVDYTICTENLRSDVSLKAVWKENTYSISYILNGGSYGRGTEPNRTSYRRNDSAFVLTNPIRDGYTFLGWVRAQYSETDVPSLSYMVDTSSGGDLAFEAVWESGVYTITYDLDGGSYRYGNTNPETYTSDDSFRLAKPYKDGYTFLGWIVRGDTDETVRSEVVVAQGTKGDLAFYAVYKENLVGLGEVTKMQKQVVEKGKNGIPRPDWVIEVPSESGFHYEKAYASGSDFQTNMKKAKEECIQYIAEWLGTSITNVTKTVNTVTQVTLTIDRSADIENAEIVEYWEDSNGGIWVLMRIGC